MILSSLALAALLSGADADLTRVAVPIGGRSGAALHADLLAASKAVCLKAEASQPGPYDYGFCVDATYSEALAQLRRARQATPAPMDVAQR